MNFEEKQSSLKDNPEIGKAENVEANEGVDNKQVEIPAQQQEQASPRNIEIERVIEKSLDAIAESGIAKIYDRSGKLVFSGTPEQMMIFWSNKDYGAIENVGGIYSEDGKSILRFGAADEHGFINRQRIEEIFQELKEVIIENRRIVEETRKLQETCERLGVQQPITPLQQTPKPQKALEAETPQEEPEAWAGKENKFDQTKTKKIIDVTKNWLKYGGNFYDSLTGKNIQLEKGVDYEINPDGTPNMESYQKARQEKIDAWLANPSNQTWLAAGSQFEQSHKNELGYGKKEVSIKEHDGTVIQKEKYTTPYFYENGWLYYETNYFDEQKGENKQLGREHTKYRVYFNLEGSDVLSTYQEIIDLLNQNLDLQNLGFQIKTADVSKVSPQEAGQLINQRDRIVLYLGEKGMKKAFPILQKYAEANMQKFNKEGVLLAQPLISNKGEEIPGITMTSETKGVSCDPTELFKKYESFSDMQSKIIESSFRSMIIALKNPKTIKELTDKYPAIKENLEKLSAKAREEDYLRAILTDPNGEEFLTKNLQSIYPQWAKAFGMRENNIAFKEKPVEEA
ncbi:MAG: hypothetical protein WCX74_00725 [Candidatus Paceibacterota bacterium]